MVQRVRGSRRRNLWVSHQGAFTVLSAAGLSQDLLINSSFPNQGMTVARTLLTMTITGSTDETAGDEAKLTYGLVMMTTDAAIGGTAEDPNTPEQTDWLMLDHAIARHPSDAVDSADQRLRVVYDLGGQRKVGSRDSSYYLVLVNEAIVGTLDIEVHFTSRVLLKMP